MKGVILAGGTGSRLYPLTRVTNKSLLPVGRKPMISHCLDLLVSSGIEEVMLVTSPDHMGHVISLLGSGSEFKCSMTYRVQDNANGIAAALRLGRSFVGNDKFVVILGDNIFEDQESLSKSIGEFARSTSEYRLYTKVVPDPQRFGVPVFSKEGKIIDIVEKPQVPPSQHAIVGLYCYSAKVFDVIEGLKPSQRGEYEISDVNSHLVRNWSGDHVEVSGGWVDAGTHESYMRANQMLWSKS
jgi:glucose-1-phosphate thymidylyltransferase